MSAPAQFIYQGQVIRDRNEMLSLTDMWKAAGAPSGRAPADWRALSSAVDFADHVAEILNAGKYGNDLFKSSRGGNTAGTWAHWQLGLAYAKYLHHDFHMWCNEVVRARMEGHSPGVVPAEVLEMIRRTDGIARQLSHKVTEIERAIPDLVNRAVEDAIAADPRRAVRAYASVRELLDEAKALTKGRNGLNRKVGHEMRRRAVLSRDPVSLLKCPHSGVWLYPRAFAEAYMRDRGAALVAGHNAHVSGQAVLPFRRPQPEAR